MNLPDGAVLQSFGSNLLSLLPVYPLCKVKGQASERVLTLTDIALTTYSTQWRHNITDSKSDEVSLKNDPREQVEEIGLGGKDSDGVDRTDKLQRPYKDEVH